MVIQSTPRKQELIPSGLAERDPGTQHARSKCSRQAPCLAKKWRTDVACPHLNYSTPMRKRMQMSSLAKLISKLLERHIQCSDPGRRHTLAMNRQRWRRVSAAKSVGHTLVVHSSDKRTLTDLGFGFLCRWAGHPQLANEKCDLLPMEHITLRDTRKRNAKTTTK